MKPLQVVSVAERANRIIVEMVRNMWYTQKLDKSFGVEPMVNAVYTQNHCTTRVLDFIYARKNMKRKEALHCTHACVWVRRLRNGVGCTMEAKHMTTSHCTKEAICLKQLLADVGYLQEGPTPIMCDNQRCIALANNPTRHSRTKHIDVQHHFIREKLENQEIWLKYCPRDMAEV